MCTRILERLDFSKNEISRNRCEMNGKKLVANSLPSTLIDDAFLTEPGKNQLRQYTDILHPYTSLPPFLPHRLSIEISGRAECSSGGLSLQSFASPTSGPPSLFQVLLRVSVARFHESFHAFPSHLGDGDGSFPFPRSPFIDRLGSLSNQPPSLVSAHQPVSIISPAFSNKDKLERSS